MARVGQLFWEQRSFEVALDEVEQLGPFLELETSAGDADLGAAQAALASLARKLDLQQIERRSYLELLLQVSDVTAG